MEIEGIGSNGILLSQHCKFTVGGVELSGISAADIVFRPGQLVQMQMIVHVDCIKLLGVAPKYSCQHPETGVLTEIEEIIFRDGDVWSSQ